MRLEYDWRRAQFLVCILEETGNKQQQQQADFPLQSDLDSNPVSQASHTVDCLATDLSLCVICQFMPFSTSGKQLCRQNCQLEAGKFLEIWQWRLDRTALQRWLNLLP